MNNLDFFKNCLTVASNTLANQMMFYARYLGKKNFPIYIRNFGDKVYLSNDEGVNEEKDYKLDRVPRGVISLQGIKFPESTRTLGTQDSFYKLESAEIFSKKIRPMKVIGYEISINIQFTLPDGLNMLQFIQYLQEAFPNPITQFSFLGDGMTNDANMFLDVANPEIDLKIGTGDNPTDLYPTIETTATIRGAYPNFGFYDLRNGGHGYNQGTINEDGQVVYDPSDIDDFTPNNDIDADSLVDKVIINTTVKSSEDGSGVTETVEITE